MGSAFTTLLCRSPPSIPWDSPREPETHHPAQSFFPHSASPLAEEDGILGSGRVEQQGNVVPDHSPGTRPMSSAASVTHWIRQLRAGDQAAAQQLWERYFHRLVGLARKKLQHARRRAADEEDVVQIAMNSFFRGVQDGRFPQL